MSTLYDAFISYSRKDSKSFATQLHDKFVENDFDIWLDLKDMPPASAFQEEINEAIENADNFIFIITPGSVTSKICRKEIDLAVELNKRIIPLMYINTMKCEECKGKMHPMIKTLDQIFFGKKQLENGEIRFEDKFEDVLKALNRQWEYVEQHKRILVNAFKWQRHQKPTHYLLIGEERVQAETWLKHPFVQELPPCEPTDLHCEYICESTVNANNLMTQVFICYAIEDKAFMLKLQQKLMRHHITVWKGKADEQTRGDFQQKVQGYIEKADNVIYLISPNSLHSEIGTQQLDYAIALNKRVIALEIENAPGGEGRNFKYDSYFEFTQWDQLIRALHEDAAYYAQHKLLLVKALKWQWHGQKETMLLRGHNLEHFATWLQNAEDREDHPPLKQQIEFVVESQKQPPVAALDVFISYSQADADLARRLNETLQQRDKTTWFDQETILMGVNFEQEIYQGIAKADNFLFILSPKAINSPYCANEVEYAAKLNKRIITVLHRPIDETSLMPILKSVQWIDFNRYEGSFITNFADLLRTLNIDRAYVRSHTEWMLEALKWSNHNRSRAYLLRDEVLMTAKAWLAQAQDKQPAPDSLVKELIRESEKAHKALKKGKLRYWLVNSIIIIIHVLISRRYIKKEAASDIKDYTACFNRGNALDDLGRYEEAIASYDKALQFKKDYHISWYNRGNALRKLGRHEDAIASYDKALRFKPDYHEAWNNRGNALAKLGRYEDAIVSYDKALQFKADKHEAWNNRALALADLGRYEDAIASYDKALQLKPDDHEAWYNRGFALADLGRYEDAIASYDKALQFKPDFHDAWYNRGSVLYKLGRYEDAIASYDKALQYKPNEALYFENRQLALDELNNSSK
ncbi:MAG: toll/interleukin-1 receptor domain-containing protein [Candidatus Parabeggiatoa sp.]|nr:toll/interleukin-1 receptor domain-containing protein [Candidatus Parabeggiatoa sp.]